MTSLVRLPDPPEARNLDDLAGLKDYSQRLEGWARELQRAAQSALDMLATQAGTGWQVSNQAAIRTIDADTATLADIIDAFCTLIADLTTGKQGTILGGGSDDGGVVDPPAIAPVNVSPPFIAGLTQVGQTLTRDLGIWSGTAPITFSTQWLRNGVDLAGGTGPTLTLTSNEIGTFIAVRVTAVNAVGGMAATSAAFGPVTDLPVGGGDFTNEFTDEFGPSTPDVPPPGGGDFTDEFTDEFGLSTPDVPPPASVEYTNEFTDEFT